MNKRTQIIIATVAVILCLIVGLLVFQPANTTSATKYQSPRGVVFSNVPEVERFGYVPNPDGTKAFLRTLDKPLLRDAGPGLFAKKATKDIFLYQAMYKAFADNNAGAQWVVGRQGIGDCVSWGWKHGLDCHLGVMYALGDSGEWHPAATEWIYGVSRVQALGKRSASYQDGSYGGAAALAVSKFGVLFRQQYSVIDLSKYNAALAREWGYWGGGGKDGKEVLEPEALKHLVKNVALVTNFDEAAAAISSGYPIPVCSGQGFTQTRDSDGFARASGSWSHCMCFIGVRFDRPGLLCLNSWGPDYFQGGKYPEDQPDGSFWIEAAVVTRMLSGRDSFAISGYQGFPGREIDNSAWVQMFPRDRKTWGERVAWVTETQYALAP